MLLCSILLMIKLMHCSLLSIRGETASLTLLLNCIWINLYYFSNVSFIALCSTFNRCIPIIFLWCKFCGVSAKASSAFISSSENFNHFEFTRLQVIRLKNTRSISHTGSCLWKMVCVSVNLEIKLKLKITDAWSRTRVLCEDTCFWFLHARWVSEQHWQLFRTQSLLVSFLAFPNELILHPTVGWHHFQLNWRALGGDFSYAQWKLLSDCAFTSVCWIRFTSEHGNETTLSLFESQWKTNHKWGIDSWRLCWHFLSYYVEFKSFGVLITALDFERLHSIWWIHCGLSEPGWSIRLECDLEGCQHPSSIYLPALWSICDCWPICVIHLQVSPNKQTFWCSVVIHVMDSNKGQNQEGIKKLLLWKIEQSLSQVAVWNQKLYYIKFCSCSNIIIITFMGSPLFNVDVKVFDLASF